MTNATPHHCSTCGAPAPEGSRECEYCRSPLATTRCAGCFQLNASHMRHCSGCGDELGLEPLARAGELPCPACGVSLTELDPQGARVLDCSRCGGQFVEHQTLRSLLERKRQLGRASLGGLRQKSLPSAAVVYRPCPLCGELMNRKNFGGHSGVVLDVCTRHGTWCESGELAAVLAFVASGGLERVRAAPSRESSRSVAAHIGNPPAPLDAGDALLLVAVELLALVLGP